MKTLIPPDFDQPINREATDAVKYDACGHVFGTNAVQPLWVADMDLPVPPFLQEGLRKRIEHPCYGYTMQSNALKKSIQWWMQEEHGVRVGPEKIFFSPSVVTTMSNAIAAFTEKGEGIAIFPPVYERFYASIINLKRTVVNIPLLLDGQRYSIDFTAFEQACRSGSTKMVLFCNPQNPSGRVWSKEELTELVRICRENRVLLIADEIHSDIIFPKNSHTSLLAVDGAQQCTLLAHSIGKTFNCSGLQPSFVLIPDHQLRRQFHAETERTHTGDINLIAKIAIQTLFSKEGQQYKKKVIHYLAGNRDFLAGKIAQLRQVTMMAPEATFLAWLDFRGTGLPHKEIKQKLITEAGLGLSDGLAYDPDGEGWFRFNFGIARQELEKAAAKLEATFE